MFERSLKFLWVFKARHNLVSRSYFVTSHRKPGDDGDDTELAMH